MEWADGTPDRWMARPNTEPADLGTSGPPVGSGTMWEYVGASGVQRSTYALPCTLHTPYLGLYRTTTTRDVCTMHHLMVCTAPIAGSCCSRDPRWHGMSWDGVPNQYSGTA
jgi:hypothetical protein